MKFEPSAYNCDVKLLVSPNLYSKANIFVNVAVSLLKIKNAQLHTFIIVACGFDKLTT